MKPEHLNEEAISRWTAGERDAAAAEHLRTCPECSAAIAGIEAVFSGFRRAAQVWAESCPQSLAPLNWRAAAEASRRTWTAPRRWAAVAATIVLLAAFPAYRSYSRHQAAERARADAVLLQEINEDITRPAPEPLEPLIQLVSQTTTGDNR